ncbi:hypothetical protein KP509_15G073800 [Ceratopteris richardii]|uniref:QWRF motif-containing protein 2 n=1 Tax=Ceratopteris richardii TaxID=49495 RepID=A0A8T2T4S2_CERRI|nr:hypothetical protein KP509_15G073800 [Ceratopteris richardii]
MVSADPFCVAPARSSLLNHCIDNNHHRHHGRASVQSMLDKSSSSTSSSSSSSPSSVTPTPARSKLQQPRSKEIASRYRSPTPDIASRYRSPTPAHVSSIAGRRFASPIVERSHVDVTPSSKRAISAERRRPSPTRTGLDSKLASVANGDGNSSVLPQRRNPPGNNSVRSDVLWPASRNLYSSMQADVPSSSPKSPAKTRHASRGRSSSNISADQTLKPSPNTAQRISDQRRKTPERKGTPLRRHNLDQLENATPPENAQRKLEPVLKHRWPSSLSILKLYGTALSKSVDLASDREKSTGRGRSVNMLHSRPTSFSSQVIPRVLPNSSGVYSHTINEGPASSVFRTAARKLTMDNNKSRVCGRDSPVKSRKGTPARDDVSGLSAASSRSGSSVDLVRQSEEEAELASEEYSADDMQRVSKSASSTPTCTSLTRGASVPARFLSDASSGKPRVPPDTYRLQVSTCDPGYSRNLCGRQSGTRQRLTPSLETRAGNSSAPPWPGIPNYSATAYKPAHHRSLSPLKLPSSSSSLRSRAGPAGTKASTLALSSSSSSPNRPNGFSSSINFGADLRKSRKGLSQVEATYLHRILHNRLLQWRFANARADFANTTHRQAGEKLLFSVWAKTAEIRKSVTSKRIKLQQARQAHKLNTILRVQGAKLEEWASIRLDHSNALTGAIEALEAAVLRVPVNEGIKADTQAVKEAMASAVDLVHMVESSISCLLPKTDKANMLMSELAQVADQERTLLEECGDLLALASSLQVEECSLRMQLLQFEQEKARVLGHLMAGNDTDSIQ